MAEGERKRGGLPTIIIVIIGMIAGTFILPFGWGVRAFRMPSGSMQPTLYVGDHFFISKWTYGYGRYSFAPFPGVPDGRILGRAPRRGELVVFRPAPEPDRDFVKRVIGLPGDRIQIIDGALHINGEAVQRDALGDVAFTDDGGQTVSGLGYRETLPGGASYVVLDRIADGELDNTRVYDVPEGHYFVMGDDRDNSADSRVPSVMGYVPLSNFVGRVAWIIPSSSAERLQ